MRITIFGAGAIGGHLAARLASAGLDVSIVARGAHLAAIQSQGLRFIGPGVDFTVRPRAVGSAEELGPQDLVISAVKAHALPAAVDAIQPLLGPQTPVVYAINGIPWWYFHRLDGARHGGRQLDRLDPGGRLWREIGVERSLGCVVQSANEVVSPGVVRNGAAANTFVFGEPDGSMSPRLERVVAALGPAVEGVSATTDIRLAVWRKLLLNLASSSLSCLTWSTSNEIAADPALRAVYRQTVDEGALVAAALGVEIAPDLDAMLARMETLTHRTSMLQDLQGGRPVEIDGQLAAVQDIARWFDVPTPTLDILLALLVRRARQAGLYPSGDPPAG